MQAIKGPVSVENVVVGKYSGPRIVDADGRILFHVDIAERLNHLAAMVDLLKDKDLHAGLETLAFGEKVWFISRNVRAKATKLLELLRALG